MREKAPIDVAEMRSAGLSSAELSIRQPGMLRERRSKGITALGDLTSGNKCNMAQILQHHGDDNVTDKYRSQQQLYGEFAGKTASELNDYLCSRGQKKKSELANSSSRIKQLISGMPEDRMLDTQRCERTVKMNRWMKEYIPSDKLHDAFIAKYQIIDPLTGKTEIMTARKPGKANAEINVSDFDAYAVRRLREGSYRKLQGNLEQQVLGLTPNAKAPQVTFERNNHGRYGKKYSHSIECKNNWMAPADDAPVLKLLGDSKRHEMLPWVKQYSQHDPIVNDRNVNYPNPDGTINRNEDNKTFVPYDPPMSAIQAAIQNVPLDAEAAEKNCLIAASLMPKKEIPKFDSRVGTPLSVPSHNSIMNLGSRQMSSMSMVE